MMNCQRLKRRNKSEYREINKMAITVNIYYSGVNGNAKKFAE